MTDRLRHCLDKIPEESILQGGGLYEVFQKYGGTYVRAINAFLRAGFRDANELAKKPDFELLVHTGIGVASIAAVDLVFEERYHLPQ